MGKGIEVERGGEVKEEHTATSTPDHCTPHPSHYCVNHAVGSKVCPHQRYWRHRRGSLP